ncbi:dTDP-glucose 4,6-dehydratase [Thalassoporum mexicanum PCC 7367]|uniref:dTDP-glucose 4,6-dehydratase n=1 Tax=Thalassoporum mexicanum TaxID=3457544 RepID=UPI00029FA8CA|nr:dTDP-glucose 4,6-dehydratase [Pseudanabaena sp. PCC 7367]AFY69638.1 dTDP-glucose 4,6-dehydratase [Pseudanabaena sp. PCC 7367]
MDVAKGDRKTYLVTGGAGFIGANFVLKARQQNWVERIINLDKLTYAGNLQTLASLVDDPGYVFVRGDIGNQELVSYLLQQYQPDAIVNFAAESHVDRSIVNPGQFIHTNVVGTFDLLEATRKYWQGLANPEQFRFLHVSTDEVYGSLDRTDPAFSETTAYAPNSPYAASKAAADHLVRAYHHTYGLPTLTTNCSNNYGPFQFPEKLIPLMILNALEGKPLPVYGDGQNIRDWLYVEDHCDAIYTVLNNAAIGTTYNIGGESEEANIDVVTLICNLLDEIKPQPGLERKSLITFVTDRPGHDRRYAIDCRKLKQDLGWQPQESFKSGLRKTIEWYLANGFWIEQVRSGAYQDWLQQNYGQR